MIRISPLFGAMIALMAGNAAGQDQNKDKLLPDIPAPVPPLVARADNPSAWVITIKAKGKGPAAPLSNPKLPPKYLARQTWVKSGDKMRCIAEWTDGSKTVNWVAGPIEFLQNPQGEGPLISNPASDPFCHDFSQGDFERLDWLTPKEYVGAVNYQGEDCYLFRTKQAAPKLEAGNRHNLSAADLHAPTSPTTVLLSVKTRLPIMIVNDEGEFHFQFQPAPAGPLEMPEPYASMWKSFNRRR